MSRIFQEAGFLELLREIALEPEDLCELPPHPETKPGEIYLGELHMYRVGQNVPVKDYSSSEAMNDYKTRRLGKGVPVRRSAARYNFLWGFSWPVFVQEEEFNASRL